MSDLHFQFELQGQRHSLNYEDTLALFADDAIAHPFDYSTRELLAQVLAHRAPALSAMARSGQKVDPIGRARFESRLVPGVSAIGIGNLGVDTELTRFDQLSESFTYRASQSPDPTPVASFQACPAPVRTQHVAVIEQGRVCVSAFGQAVFDSSGRYVDGACRGDGVLMALADPARLPPLQAFDGSVLSLCSLWGNGYFHWMLEVLPKLLLVAQAGYPLDTIDIVLVRQKIPALMEFLAHLGIPDSRVFEWTLAPHIRARRLIAVSSLEHYDLDVEPQGIAIEPWASRIMRAHFSVPRAPGTKGRRIYIDREKAAIRKVINNAEVKDALGAHGFEFFALEELNLAQKQALFSSAEMIAGPAGAGFANLVFCQPGTEVLIFYQQGFETNSFWSLCNNNALGHHHLVAQPSHRFYPSQHAGTINENFLIDIGALTLSLETMIGAVS